MRSSLRPWRDSDLDALADLLGNADVMRFSDHGPLARDEVAAWLARERQASGTSRAVCLEGDVVGYARLTADPKRTGPNVLELGVRIHVRHWRNGLGRDAAAQLCSEAFASGAAQVIGIVDPGNHASVAMLKALGMRYQHEVWFDGYTHADHLYVLSTGDWPA